MTNYFLELHGRQKEIEFHLLRYSPYKRGPQQVLALAGRPTDGVGLRP